MRSTKTKLRHCECCEKETLQRYYPATMETNAGWECCECEEFEPANDGYEHEDVGGVLTAANTVVSDADPGL